MLIASHLFFGFKLALIFILAAALFPIHLQNAVLVKVRGTML
jgi:hypothetical protein